jgi:UDP-N-acetylglucosamine 4-epimerase
MLVASRDAGVKRFVYAASSSTYGDSENLPKIENIIGKPLSPYAITKYVNELYADIFSKTYGMECIGLRYFNVFGRKQDPNGAYAAVIPKFVLQLMQYERPLINGTGDFSRDFTYIDNVIQMNELAMLTNNAEAINTVYNTAVGDRTTLSQLVSYLKEFLSEKDLKIAEIEIIYGPNRKGDIPHSLASIEKAQKLLGYKPSHKIREGLKEAVQWYWDNLNVK